VYLSNFLVSTADYISISCHPLGSEEEEIKTSRIYSDIHKGKCFTKQVLTIICFGKWQKKVLT
jgi:hypothetical protein